MLRLIAAATLGLILLFSVAYTQDWTEPELPYGLFSFDTFEFDTQQSQWFMTRCYPSTPSRKANYHPLAGDFSHNKGYLYARDVQTASSEMNYEVMTLYRDYLRWSVRSVDIWVTPRHTSSPCGDRGTWVSMGSAFLIGEVSVNRNQQFAIWGTADHIGFLEDYERNYYVNHLRVGGVDATILPRHPKFNFSILVTPHVTWTLYPNKITSSKHPIDFFASDEDLLVGQRLYQTYVTIGMDCLPPNSLTREKCIVEYPQVNTGFVSSVIDREGAMGGYFNSQMDIMGGSSGSPTWIKVDNGDGVLNIADFKIVGIINAGWSSGNGVHQRISRKDVEKVFDYVERMRELWD